MLLLLVVIIVVIALPALAYVEYCRWRGLVVVEPPVDETDHDPPKPPETVKRLPRITDLGV